MNAFNTQHKRIGFACKFSEIHPIKGVISIPDLNCKSTTISWLNRQSKQVAHKKLIEITQHNISAIQKVIDRLSILPNELRMFRIGSDVLPAYTHLDYKDFWNSKEIQNNLESSLAPIGIAARKNNVRLSFHPDQFVVLASESDNIVNKSIQEFEYHADMARFMGYGKQFQDMKVNVHISGRRGPMGIRQAYKKLSMEARNVITIENEEITWGLDSCLELCDLLPIVLDIHHHNINCGEYIEPNDYRINKIIDSWRGVRPVIHYSTSREDVLIGHPIDKKPDLKILLEQGYKKSKLRAHSDFMWNTALNKWALSHNDWADIMVEAKAKNLASFKLSGLNP